MFLFAVWQRTRCNVPARAYSLSLSRNAVVLINFNISVLHVIGKTMQCVHSSQPNLVLNDALLVVKPSFGI